MASPDNVSGFPYGQGASSTAQETAPTLASSSSAGSNFHMGQHHLHHQQQQQHNPQSTFVGHGANMGSMYLPQQQQQQQQQPLHHGHHHHQQHTYQHGGSVSLDGQNHHPAAPNARMLGVESLNDSMSPYRFGQPSPNMAAGQQQIGSVHPQQPHHYSQGLPQHQHMLDPATAVSMAHQHQSGMYASVPHSGPSSSGQHAAMLGVGTPPIMQPNSHLRMQQQQQQQQHPLANSTQVHLHLHLQQHASADNFAPAPIHQIPQGTDGQGSGVPLHALHQNHHQHPHHHNPHQAQPSPVVSQLYPPHQQHMNATGPYGVQQQHRQQVPQHQMIPSPSTPVPSQPPAQPHQFRQPPVPPFPQHQQQQQQHQQQPMSPQTPVSSSTPARHSVASKLPFGPSSAAPGAHITASVKRERSNSNPASAKNAAGAKARNHGADHENAVGSGGGSGGKAAGGAAGTKGKAAAVAAAAAASAASAAAADTPPKSDGITTVTIFQCRGFEGCNMTFSRSEHLARHVRKHTGERPFPCHCGKAFSRLDNLRQHAQTVHSDTPDKNETMMQDLVVLHANLAASAAQMQHAHMQVSNKLVTPEEREAAAAAAAGADMQDHHAFRSASGSGSGYVVKEEGAGGGDDHFFALGRQGSSKAGASPSAVSVPEKVGKKESKARKAAAAAAAASSTGGGGSEHSLYPPPQNGSMPAADGGQAIPSLLSLSMGAHGGGPNRTQPPQLQIQVPMEHHQQQQHHQAQQAAMLMRASPALSAMSATPHLGYATANMSQPAPAMTLQQQQQQQQQHSEAGLGSLQHVGSSAMGAPSVPAAMDVYQTHQTGQYGLMVNGRNGSDGSNLPFSQAGQGISASENVHSAPGHLGTFPAAAVEQSQASPAPFPNGTFVAAQSGGPGAESMSGTEQGGQASSSGTNLNAAATGATATTAATAGAATFAFFDTNGTSAATPVYSAGTATGTATPGQGAVTAGAVTTTALAPAPGVGPAANQQTSTPTTSGNPMLSGGYTGGSGSGSGGVSDSFTGRRESAFSSLSSYHTFGGPGGHWSSASTLRNNSFGDPLGPGGAFGASAAGPGPSGGAGDGHASQVVFNEYDQAQFFGAGSDGLWYDPYNMGIPRERSKSQSHGAAYHQNLLSALQMRSQNDGVLGMGDRRMSRAVTPPPPGSARGRPVSASGRPSGSISRPASSRQSIGLGSVVPFGQRPSSSAGMMGFMGLPPPGDFSLFGGSFSAGSGVGGAPSAAELPSIESHLAATSESVSGSRQGRPFTPSVARQVLLSSDGRSGSVFGGLGTRIRTGSKDFGVGPLGERRMSRPSISMESIGKRPTTASTFDPFKFFGPTGFFPPGSSSGRTGSRASIVGSLSMFSNSFPLDRGRPSSSSGAMTSALASSATELGASGTGAQGSRIPGLAHRLNTAGSDLRTSPPAASPFMFQPPPVTSAGKEVAPILPPLGSNRPSSSSRRPLGSMGSLFSAPPTADPLSALHRDASTVLPALRFPGKRPADNERDSDSISKADSERHAPRPRTQSPTTARANQAQNGTTGRKAGEDDDGSADDARLLLTLSSRGSAGDGTSRPAKPFGATDASFKKKCKDTASDDGPDDRCVSISMEKRLSIASLLGPEGGPGLGSRPSTASGVPLNASPTRSSILANGMSPTAPAVGGGNHGLVRPSSAFGSGGKKGLNNAMTVDVLQMDTNLELSPKSLPSAKFLDRDRSTLPASSN
ncbi:unnamed protein product [Tilletia laevis]|uniref:C2H2-type domain-containing protein n=2 Tax=Tilletia TaxID=13289 RepID=A0A177UA10_9BASI|nr:hypothetical protein CF335_g6175 [Tilletia laevis]KAE8252493.1 hypothetical protein A4X03_0g6148 [Tilletia caries]CAD6902722.1 unnamed protein product [Tilletia caries]CAD6949375.1 unnamed protein product [Tilletia laevis]CAD6960089.1 unnamed protein product [Tilletia caries]